MYVCTRAICIEQANFTCPFRHCILSVCVCVCVCVCVQQVIKDLVTHAQGLESEHAIVEQKHTAKWSGLHHTVSNTLYDVVTVRKSVCIEHNYHTYSSSTGRLIDTRTVLAFIGNVEYHS
jgi:hypothetical protein